MKRSFNLGYETQVRTSQTHPLRVDEVAASDTGGCIGVTFCPGKCGPSISGYIWKRDLAKDLDVVASWGASAVVTLIEPKEIVALNVEGLGFEVERRGMQWHHLPIVDLQAPDQQFEIAWNQCRLALLDILRQGGRVLVHCRGGLGRAGTIAARLLVELGVSPQQAVNQVREARPRAIETREQLNYVLGLLPVPDSPC